MIPVGLAATVLSNVGSAISSGLSHLTGKTSATQSSQSSQSSFASQLKAATGSTSASNATESKQHHHVHIKGGALSALADASQVTPQAASATVGSVINISA